MPYTVYKIMHLLGILMLFLAFGGVINHAINGGTKATNAWRLPAALTHGLGLVLALVGGFGLFSQARHHLAVARLGAGEARHLAAVCRGRRARGTVSGPGERALVALAAPRSPGGLYGGREALLGAAAGCL